MLDISLSDLNRIQLREPVTGRILLYVEGGAVKCNYSVPTDQILGSVPALFEFAVLIRSRKIVSESSIDGAPYTGRVVTYYEQGKEVARENLGDDLHIASLPNLIEQLIDSGFSVTPN